MSERGHRPGCMALLAWDVPGACTCAPPTRRGDAVVSPRDCGTGTVVEPSRYADEDEEREAALRAQAEEHDMVERQWAAYVREQAARGNASNRS